MSDEKHEIGEKIGGVQLKPGSTSRPAIAYQNDEDTGIYQRVPGENNFVSDGVEVARTNADGILIPTFVAGRTVTVGAGGQLEDTVTSGGHTIRENGTDQTDRTGLNFIDTSAGAGLITDDPGGDETEVNLNLYLLASGARVMTGDLDMGGNDILSVRNMYPDPGGRLTLTSATPVLVADAADQTTLYYALYKHDLVPLFDGTDWDVFRFTELSIAMAASANWAANSNFDCYIFNDAGTLRLVTGAAWTDDTTRSETLTRVNGRWTNNASMTGRYGAASTVTVAANRGLYVGSFRTTGTAGTTTFIFGGVDTAGSHLLWNTYNRISAGGIVQEGATSWTYSTAAWRSLNADATNRISFIRGLNEDMDWVYGTFSFAAAGGGGDVYLAGIGLDSTTALATGVVNQRTLGTTAIYHGTSSMYAGFPGLGFHFLQFMEYNSTGANAVTVFGDNAEPLVVQHGLSWVRKY